MDKSTYEIQVTDRVKRYTSDANEVIWALLIEAAPHVVRAIRSIRSIRPSEEPGYMGGGPYELETDRAVFDAQVRKR